MNPKNIVISVVGDVIPTQITRMIQKYICMPKSTYKLPATPKRESASTKITSIETNKPGKQQAHIVLGFQASWLGSPDHYTMIVLNQILSGQGGRLFVELRDRLSLAYSVSSIYQPGIDPGFFAVYIGTEAKKTPVAIDAIKRELAKLTEKAVSKEEIKRAREYLIGTHELESQRFSSLSSTYAFNLLYGIGVNDIHKYHIRIKEITREDILRVARKYINMNAYTLSVVRP